MLGKGGSGRLRIVAKEQKMKLSAKTAKKVARQHASGRGGTVSGLTSTLAFTPVQGFELTDPSKAAGGQSADLQRSGTESYFSTMSGFRTIKKLG